MHALWVDDALSRSWLARALMEEAEDEARRPGCRLVMVLTYDVLIADFYDRLGYRTVGAIEDCPKGTTTRWYRKDLVVAIRPVCRNWIVPRARFGFIGSMSETLDELGPVDYIVVEFPGNKFNGDVAPALGDLVHRDLVKVLDLVFVTKDADGTIEGFELSDIDEGIAGEIEKLEIDIAHVLSEEDVISLAGAMEPDSSAALLVWENKWAAPFASAVRHSGGQLVASGRIPVQALIGALEDEDEGD